MKKKTLIILLLVVGLCTFPFILSNITPEIVPEEGNEVKYINYTDLGIVSAKKPNASNLFIETNSSGTLYIVPVGETSEIYKSVDKGETWSQPNGDFSRGVQVISFFHDRTNSKLYGVDLQNVFVIDLDTDAITEYGIPDFAGQGWVGGEGFDVYLLAGTLYCTLIVEDFPANSGILIGSWGGAVWTIEDTWVSGMNQAVFANFGVIIGDKIYFSIYNTVGTYTKMVEYDDSASTITVLDTLGNRDTPGYNQKAMAYDGNDLIYFTAKSTIDAKVYLHSYSIIGGNITTLGRYNISLMQDRNTEPGIKEKAFHLTEDKVYQLQTHTTQLNLIAEPDTDAVIIAITDNFFMNSDGDMWEYEDQIGLLASVLIDHEVEEASQCVITLIKGSIPIVKNMLMRFFYTYTTAGGTSEELIFEGLVTNFNEDPMQTVMLVSPAKKEIKTILPEGSYTKDADGLLSQLIIDYNNYVTEGTFSDGDDLGTITLGGVHTEETIFDGCAKFDGFLWYFNPTGQLFYNNGTIDSGVNYSQADVLSGVNISHVHEEYNKIKVRGTYVNGVQVESEWKEDLASQQEFGINERVFLISFLNTIALCNIAASNILTILAKDPLRVKFTIKDTTKGYVQVGETITFEYAASGKTVAYAQFIITSATINKYGDVRYTIVSELS